MSTRHIRLTCFVFSLMLISAISTNSASAQSLVSARVLSADGPVEIRRAPASGVTLKKIDFRANDSVRAGDRIITGWGGRLVLGLTDGSQVILSEHTVIDIKDWNTSPRDLFEVLRGKTRVYIEKLGGRPNPYRVNAPTAVIAVRGTLFDVIASSNETQVFVHEGEVAVSSLLAPDQIILLSPGQMTRVRRSQQPTPPVAFKPGRNDDSFRRTAARATDDITERTADDDDARRLSDPGTNAAGRNAAGTSTPATGGQRTSGRRP